jgi:tRNA threonylcarbamoyladenosine biosynthesis protein TsaB
MTAILAIETSSAACSAALSIDGEIVERYALAPRQHASLLLPMVESLLVEAGLNISALDACAFGRGPGSFTGVRIAASVIQGIAFAAGLPVVAVSTLAALAAGGARESHQENILAALDARKDEVYFAAYRITGNDQAVLFGEEIVCTPAAVVIPEDDEWVGVGSGWAAHAEVLAKTAGDRVVRIMHDLEPRAHDVATIAATDFLAGRVLDASEAVPVYLRNNVADERKPSA